METIFKYKLSATNPKVELPKYAEVLSVAVQGSVLYMWARVDDDIETEIRHFEVYQEGHPMENGYDLNYIGTAQTTRGLVFHVFERDICSN